MDRGCYYVGILLCVLDISLAYRARSIINVLEERQGAQERALSTLKDQLQQLSEERKEDRKVMDALREMVADTAWGVTEIKLQQQQLRDDFGSIKLVQDIHNDTVSGLGSFAGESAETHAGHAAAIRHLQGELLALKTEMRREKSSNHRAMLALHNKVVAMADKLTHDSSARENGVISHKDFEPEVVVNSAYSNKIPNAPGAATSGSSEHSGDSSKPKFDSKSSTIEESRNTLDNDLEQLRRNEHHMKKELGGFQQRFIQYDAELSKLYALFYNLSLGMANLENKLLTKQQTQHKNEIQDLQRSFMDFTQQIFHLEQSYMSNKAAFNTTSQNEQQIQQMAAILDNHSSRLRTFEEVVRDYKAMNQQNYRLLMTYIERLNDSMSSSHHKIHRHQNQATDIMDDLDSQLEQIHNVHTTNSHRLDAIEIKVLNASLLECQRDSANHKQDAKLSELSRRLDDLNKWTKQTEGKVFRLDKSASQLFDIAEQQTGSVNTLMEQLTSLWDIIPDVRAVQREITHLLTQVHHDCAEIQRYEVYHPDGVYVLKPSLSTQSLLAPCQFSAPDNQTPDAAWTLLQRRTDGKTTFARAWQEYKHGFGDPASEFWIGLDNLYYFTNQDNYMLRIELWDMDDNYYYADYSLFHVDDEDAKYLLHIGGYSGNATDAMKYSNLMPFSTPDRDNDVSSTHCAKFYTAGWWYKHCHYGNLNGRFTVGVVWFNHDLDEWVQMSRTIMKIRPLPAKDSNAIESG